MSCLSSLTPWVCHFVSQTFRPRSIHMSSGGPYGLVHGHPHRYPSQPGDRSFLSVVARAREITESGAHGDHAQVAYHPEYDDSNPNTLERPSPTLCVTKTAAAHVV